MFKHRYVFNYSYIKIDTSNPRRLFTNAREIKLTFNFRKNKFLLSSILSITTIWLLDYSHKSRKRGLLLETHDNLDTIITKSQHLKRNFLIDQALQKLNKLIVNPIRLLLRLIFLIYCFSPVILLSPICFFGKRIAELDNTRSGCIIWYSILVNQLEKAGATFIKVKYIHAKVGTMGCL